MAETPKQTKILLVDDDESMLAFWDVVLSEEGFHVTTVEGGEDAWTSIREGAPDLVICDYMLPDLDGGELLNKLRSNNRFRHLPFIMLTGNIDPVQMLEQIEGGADDYLIKPIAPEELLKRMRAVLDKYSLEPSLQGNLRNLTLPDLLQLLNQNRRSGYLKVSQGAEQFVFAFLEGELLSVESGSRTSRGQKAVFRALAHDEGDFSFHSQDKLPAVPDSVASEEAEEARAVQAQGLGSIGYLCMEGLRFRDELPQLMSTFAHENPLFQRIFGDQVNISLDDLSVLESVLFSLLEDSFLPMSLSALLDELPETIDYEIIQALQSLTKAGLIEILTPSDVFYDAPSMELDKKSHSIARASNIPSYQDFVVGLLSGDQAKALVAIEAAFAQGMAAELVFHRILSAAVVDILRYDELNPGTIHHNPERQEVLQAVLDHLWPRFSGRPPLQATIVLSWPHAPSAARLAHITWLRAAGFGVFELGVDLQPSRIFESVVHSGSSLLCMMVETEEAAQRLQAVHRFFGRWKHNNMELLAGGEYLQVNPGAVPAEAQEHVALGLFDLLRKAYHLLKIPISAAEIS